MKLHYVLLSFFLLHCFAIPVAGQETKAPIKSSASEHYDRGEELLNEMKFNEAEDEFRKAIALDSTFGLAYFRLAYTFEWQMVERAHRLETLQKAMALSDGIPEEERLLLKAYHTYVENGHEAGIAMLKKMEAIYPTSKEMMYNLGDWYFHIDELAAAEKYLTRLLAIAPNFERAFGHLIWTYESMQSYPMMFEIAKRYVTISESPESYELLANAYIRTDNVDAGLQELQKAQAKYPDNEGIKGGIVNLYIHQGEFEKARDALSSIHDSVILLSIGGNLFQQNKYQEAEEVFRRGLESNPDHPELFNGLGWNLLRQQKHREAEEVFLTGYELDAEHPAIINGLARLKTINKDYDAAVSYIMKLIRAFPAGRWWGETQLGQIALIRKNYVAAEQHLQAAVAIDSSPVWINREIGYLFSEQEQFDAALEFAQKAISSDSSFANSNLMGWVLIAGELDVEQGLEFAQKALDSKPDDYILTANTYPYLALPDHTLGLAYLKQGQYRRAIQYLEQAAEQLPERQTIQDDLQLAKQKLETTNK